MSDVEGTFSILGRTKRKMVRFLTRTDVTALPIRGQGAYRGEVNYDVKVSIHVVF